MMKRLAVLGASSAVFLLLAAPAGATWFGWGNDEVTVRNSAYVKNSVTTRADTGDNSVHGKYVWGGAILTGTAFAGSSVANDVNYTGIGCGCADDVTVTNRATVRNYVTTKADTGDNSVGGYKVFGGDIWTGSADAEAMVSNFVNTTLVGGTE